MEEFDSAGVTGIVWRRIRPGFEEEAERLMREIMHLSRQAEGYLGSEIFPPIPGVQDAYVVLYRFNRGANLRRWLECEGRQKLREKLSELLLAPSVEFFFSHGRHEAASASSVFAYRIRPEQAEAFRDWRRRILEEVRKWDGFLGTESFDTLEGGEPEFIVVVRFDTRAHLDAWLGSQIRKNFMEEVGRYVEHYSLRRIGSGFEGWFDFSDSAAPPARWRQALVILSALFPVILVMRMVLAPLFRMLPLPLAFLILLAVDMVILTYGIMPHYSRWMAFWLRPRGNWTPARELAGLSVILGILAATLVVFLTLVPAN